VPTLENFAPKFMTQHVRANRHKPSSVAATESILRWHLIPLFGSKRLDEITTEQVEHLKVQREHLKPKTVNNVLTVLGTLLRKAIEWENLDRMPCKIEALDNPKKEMEFHDHAEYGRLLQSANDRGLDTYLMVLLAGEAGLRLGEIVALEWSDLDLQAGRLTVQRSDWRGHVTVPKSNRTRWVPLSGLLGPALLQAQHRRSERVLCLPDGSPITRDRVIKAIKRAQRDAGLRQGVHILRHTFCSHLAMGGAHVPMIQALAGHSDLSTTQRYMHVGAAAREEAIRVLDRRVLSTARLETRGDIVKTAR